MRVLFSFYSQPFENLRQYLRLILPPTESLGAYKHLLHGGYLDSHAKKFRRLFLFWQVLRTNRKRLKLAP